MRFALHLNIVNHQDINVLAFHNDHCYAAREFSAEM